MNDEVAVVLIISSVHNPGHICHYFSRRVEVRLKKKYFLRLKKIMEQNHD